MAVFDRIYVYGNWKGPDPEKIGTLYIDSGRGKIRKLFKNGKYFFEKKI